MNTWCHVRRLISFPFLTFPGSDGVEESRSEREGGVEALRKLFRDNLQSALAAAGTHLWSTEPLMVCPARPGGTEGPAPAPVLALAPTEHLRHTDTVYWWLWLKQMIFFLYKKKKIAGPSQLVNRFDQFAVTHDCPATRCLRSHDLRGIWVPDASQGLYMWVVKIRWGCFTCSFY